MDGVYVSTSTPLQRLAAYVKRRLPEAGYHIQEGRRTGDLKRLAQATQQAAERLGPDFNGLDVGALSRLIRGERMPRASALAPLADALGVEYKDLLIEAGIIPGRHLAHNRPQWVGSRPTPEQVADAWGIHDERGRSVVRAMYESLAKKPEPPAADDPGAEAN